MSGDADRLLALIASLNQSERRVLRYFLENVSVGELRAVKELSSMGIDDPEEVIASLVDKGFLEEGSGCYNLVEPLREYVRKRGVPRL
ncbi:MAG: hypothetical protein F7B20_02220 [Aeropyrum sp.]|nr:hypothetical protein [Aeropyrum sp.]MCE4615826.1 hypothetical protein [Aeropyrum sp.]